MSAARRSNLYSTVQYSTVQYSTARVGGQEDEPGEQRVEDLDQLPRVTPGRQRCNTRTGVTIVDRAGNEVSGNFSQNSVSGMFC